MHVSEGYGTTALQLLSRSNMRSLVKDQWLGNYLTHAGAPQMDCGSYLTSGPCQPAKCTSPLGDKDLNIP